VRLCKLCFLILPRLPCWWLKTSSPKIVQNNSLNKDVAVHRRKQAIKFSFQLRVGILASNLPCVEPVSSINQQNNSNGQKHSTNKRSRIKTAGRTSTGAAVVSEQALRSLNGMAFAKIITPTTTFDSIASITARVFHTISIASKCPVVAWWALLWVTVSCFRAPSTVGLRITCFTVRQERTFHARVSNGCRYHLRVYALFACGPLTTHNALALSARRELITIGVAVWCCIAIRVWAEFYTSQSVAEFTARSVAANITIVS